MAERRDDDEITQEIEVPAQGIPTREVLTLQVVRGPRVGEITTLEKARTVLGRGGDADLRIPDPSLSRLHARFDREGDAVSVTDLNSRNGTLVEGKRIKKPQRLLNGNHITAGSVVLRFTVQEAATLHASRALYEAATRDRLTGMHNRGYFDDRMAQEFAYARRHDTPLSVLLLDLDHFKQINDTYGHSVGDAVLQAAARKIKDSLRAEDVAARYGGEEFVVMARSTGVDGALVLAQRLRTRIAMAQVLTLKGVVQVTTSIGVAVIDGSHNYRSPAEFIAAADEALYAAKRGGRDRVSLNSDPNKATEQLTSAMTGPPHQRTIKPSS